MKKTMIAAITAGLVAMGVAVQAQAGAEDTYKAKCQACHASGVAGAPKMGDKAAWEPRIAAGMDAMMATVINGKGAMPPKGTCMDCSEDDLKAVVEYMVNGSQ